MDLLEIAVDNLASTQTADQQGDGRRAKWVGPLSFRTPRTFDLRVGHAPQPTVQGPADRGELRISTFAGMSAEAVMHSRGVGLIHSGADSGPQAFDALRRMPVSDFSGGTRGVMIGVTRAVVTDLTGEGPMIVQVRRV